MATIHKRQNIIGIKKASTWGTAVTPGTDDGVFIETLTGIERARDYIPFKDAGRGLVTGSALSGIKEVDLSLETNFWFTGLELLLALVFGSHSQSQPDATGAPNTYEHKFVFQEDILGLFATLAYEEDDEVKGVPSVKFHTVRISVGDGGVIKAAFDGKGNEVKVLSMASPTFPDDNKKAPLFRNTTITLDGIAITPSDMTITLARPVATAQVAGQDYIPEPTEGEFPELTIDFSFYKKDPTTKALLDALDTEPEKKLKLNMVGPLIEAAYNFEIGLYFPKVKVIKVNYPFEDVIRAEITLAAEKATSTVAGFDELVPYVVVRNNRSFTF